MPITFTSRPRGISDGAILEHPGRHSLSAGERAIHTRTAGLSQWLFRRAVLAGAGGGGFGVRFLPTRRASACTTDYRLRIPDGKRGGAFQTNRKRSRTTRLRTYSSRHEPISDDATAVRVAASDRDQHLRRWRTAG